MLIIFGSFMLYVTSHGDLLFGSKKTITIKFKYQIWLYAYYTTDMLYKYQYHEAS